MTLEPTNHFHEAERELERADMIANADRWRGDRDLDVSQALLRAQVHATLALAKEAREQVKATYSGALI